MTDQTKNPKVVLVTFATKDYYGAQEALRHSALLGGGFDEVHAFREADVADFFAKHPAHLVNSRGYGWWAWKPYLIARTLKRLDEGDLLVYCDSTMVFERAATSAVTRGHVAGEFQGIVDLPENRSVRLFALGGWNKHDYRNARWTKRATIEAMDPKMRCLVDDPVQLNAGIQVYRNTPMARAFVSEYRRWCSDLSIVNDDGKDLPGIDGTIEDHRHDQSVLTLLANTPEWEDEVSIVRDVTQYGVDDPTPVRNTDDFWGGAVPDPAADGPVVFHHRKKLRLPKVAVITPTTGGPFLVECVASVQRNKLPNVEHWVVTDGEEHRAKVDAVLANFAGKMPIVNLVLPRNVGAGGWNGHRVYAGIPPILDADFVCYLDDDNAVDPDHYRDLLSACLGNDTRWAHSLRRIVDRDGKRVCDDNCESLGGITHTVNGMGDYLIDTSCYMLRRDLAVDLAPVWNARFRDPDREEPDRALCKALLSSSPGSVVRKHSLVYRVGSTDRSVTADFFRRGNAVRRHNFARHEDVYVFHFSAAATATYMKLRSETDGTSHALDEWQMTLWKGLDGAYGLPGDTQRFNLIDGYASAPNLPHGATVLVTMCHPEALPLGFLAERTDLRRIVYTLESPNVRHQKQWDVGFLKKHFDVIMTYWKPLLDDPRVRTVFTPHNTHHGDLDNPIDRMGLLRHNRSAYGAPTPRSCAMVLERRKELYDKKYTINGVALRSLDRMREDLVIGLRDVTVFGKGWKALVEGVGAVIGIKLGHDVHRSDDPKSSVDLLQNYAFAVIVENCDAEWYASEKLYDALSAGCVPLYWGSVPPQLEIPEGPETGVYIDLRARGLDCGFKVQHFLDGLSDDTVAAMRQRVVDLREGILRKVGTEAFAACVREAIAAA